MKVRNSLAGMLTVEFTSASPETLLHRITSAKIPISHVVQKHELTYQIRIHRRDYRHLTRILGKQGVTPVIVRRMGVYWGWKALLHRPVLLGMMLLTLLSSLYLPSRIFFISVQGNDRLPEGLILSAAQQCGIRFGSSRKLVRSEKVKNALLSAVPQLQWAGINTSGCTAVISVKERMQEKRPEEKLVSNLIADRDGYIISTTVISGTPHVSPGQSVTKGQLLISGYTDCGICIRATRAQGEILAQTNRQMVSVTPATYARPQAKQKANFKISLLVRKKRIILWKDSSISDGVCGRMYAEYYVCAPGGFQLPFALCIDRYLDYDLQEAAISETDAQLQLQQFSRNYLMKQMISGEIIRKQQFFTGSDSLYCLKTHYTCAEIIGKERREQIGVMNGKRN